MNRDLKVVSAALFTMALGEGLFLPFSPLYMEELGASPEQIGLLAALVALTQMVAMIPAGIASDRWGPRPLLLGGWMLAVLTASIMAAAPNLEVYAIGYAGYGLTFGVIPPLTSTIAAGRANLSPARAFTRVYGFFRAGFVVSPVLGGLIGEAYGLRTSYFLATLLILVSAGIMTQVGSTSPRPVQVAGGRPTNLIRRRSYLLFLVIVFAISFASSLGIPLAPNFLQDRWGVPLSRVGLLNSVASLGAVALTIYLGSRRPRRALIVLQAAVMIYLLIIVCSGQLGWLALGFFLQSGGMISRQFLDAISTRIVEPTRLGLAYALNNSVTRAATVVASALAGYLYAVRPGLPFELGLPLIPLAAGLAWWKLPGARGKAELEAGNGDQAAL